MRKLNPHPLAELLPMMTEAEYESLRDDINANGQTDPIELFEGKILDGRNRYRACVELNKEPVTREFKGTYAQAVQRVYARVNHRHLNDSQKAAVACNFLDRFEELARQRMSKHARQKVDTLPEGRATENAGKLLGVSRQYVFEARKLRDADSKLFQTVFNGERTLSEAKREVARRNKAKAHRAIAKRIAPVAGQQDQWDVFTGDCIKAMEIMPAGRVRVVFADSPYNIGINYGRGAKADRLPETQFLSWCESWMGAAHRILSNDGSMFVMIDGFHLAAFEALMKGESGTVPAMFRRAVIIWIEGFGNYEPGNFTNCWRAILYFTKSEKNYVWHGDQILIPSDRQTKYGDSRANPAGKVPSNVWDFPRVVDNAKERVPGVPTQIPQALVERIVLCASDPGDLVFDPFTGSGTTGAAAVTHHRKFAGAEINPRYAELARARIGRAIAERKA